MNGSDGRRFRSALQFRLDNVVVGQNSNLKFKMATPYTQTFQSQPANDTSEILLFNFDHQNRDVLICFNNVCKIVKLKSNKTIMSVTLCRDKSDCR